MHPFDGGIALGANFVHSFHERALVVWDATATVATIPAVLAANQPCMPGGVAPDNDRKKLGKAAYQLPDV